MRVDYDKLGGTSTGDIIQLWLMVPPPKNEQGTTRKDCQEISRTRASFKERQSSPPVNGGLQFGIQFQLWPCNWINVWFVHVI